MKRGTRKRIKEFDDWQKEAFKELMPSFCEAQKPIEKNTELTISVPVHIVWDEDCDWESPQHEELYDVLCDSCSEENEDRFERLIAQDKRIIQEKINHVWELVDSFAEKHEIDSDYVFEFLTKNKDLYDEKVDISMSGHIGV